MTPCLHNESESIKNYRADQRTQQLGFIKK